MFLQNVFTSMPTIIIQSHALLIKQLPVIKTILHNATFQGDNCDDSGKPSLKKYLFSSRTSLNCSLNAVNSTVIFFT